MTHFPGWMLESAHNYLKAAELLHAQNLPHVAMVNAAIGMEMLLKKALFSCQISTKVRLAKPTSSTSKLSKRLTSTCSQSARFHPNKSVMLTIC